VVVFQVLPLPEPPKPFPWRVVAVVTGVILLLVLAAVIVPRVIRIARARALASRALLDDENAVTQFGIPRAAEALAIGSDDATVNELVLRRPDSPLRRGRVLKLDAQSRGMQPLSDTVLVSGSLWMIQGPSLSRPDRLWRFVAGQPISTALSGGVDIERGFTRISDAMFVVGYVLVPRGDVFVPQWVARSGQPAGNWLTKD
jgi:hypothetical protein